jgi:ABC-type transport system involved in multi-copper enzyme maturation permease subunit
VRILLVLELPVFFIGAALIRARGRQGGEGLTFMVFALWILVALAISALAPNTVLSERTNQTLEALLTTPLTGREILLQKMRGLRRLLIVFMVPFFTLFVMKTLVRYGDYRRPGYDAEQVAAYAICSVGMVLLYLPMLAWVGMWLGLRLRRRAVAVIAMLLLVVVWNVLPIVVGVVLHETHVMSTGEPPGSYMFLLSPAATVIFAEMNVFDDLFDGWALPMTVAFLWHGGILLFVRRLCLDRADKYLGRVPSEPEYVVRAMAERGGHA